MQNCIRFILLLACLLALAACGGATNSSSSPTPTHPVVCDGAVSGCSAPTAARPTPTSTSAAGMTVYTSPDHTYQLSYPTGWQVSVADGDPGKVDFSGPNQDFEVNDAASTAKGADPAQLITDYCNAIGHPTSQVVTGTPVVLAGQTWFKAQCGDDPQPSEPLIVEVVTYQGAVYQINYSSPAASFQSDDASYYAPMEQSFQFLT